MMILNAGCSLEMDVMEVLEVGVVNLGGGNQSRSVARLRNADDMNLLGFGKNSLGRWHQKVLDDDKMVLEHGFYVMKVLDKLIKRLDYVKYFMII